MLSKNVNLHFFPAKSEFGDEWKRIECQCVDCGGRVSKLGAYPYGNNIYCIDCYVDSMNPYDLYLRSLT